MTAQPECVHNFSYLVKSYGDGAYTARVQEIPAVFVSGNDLKNLGLQIEEATKGYLKMFDEEHTKAMTGSLPPILESPKAGIVVSIEKFSVEC